MQNEKNTIEKEFMERAAPLVHQLFRTTRLSQSRGHDQQRSLRQLIEQDKGAEIVSQMLQEPCAEAAEVAE
jgi:hypothetical protein